MFWTEEQAIKLEVKLCLGEHSGRWDRNRMNWRKYSKKWYQRSNQEPGHVWQWIYAKDFDFVLPGVSNHVEDREMGATWSDRYFQRPLWQL